MGGLDPGAFALVFTAVLLGSTVQAVVGLGIGLIAAPVITLVAPELMPGVLIALAFVLPCVTLVHDHEDIDWHGLNWSLPSRLVGTAGGVWVVATFTADQLGAFIGAIVLLAVTVTWRAVTVPVNRGTLSAAGFVGGVTGTATSIGGPPFALLYQHRPPPQIRSTMAVYFLVGAAISLVGLGLSGDLEAHQLAVAGVLLPAVGLGVLLGAPLRRVLPAHRVRPAVLLVSAASALVLVVRSLL
ncbi:sulfite transporter TauE/SafE [Nocardioides sp. Root1257]|uniref:sulfite exporter TauE/SafE family protein n=1 Tax=unclassified Nocardioides TaxID=2615069 RepID=UPI0006F58117|nr:MULTISPECIES: sulfite exporter TauE/SafE family protein [unclassified Nocardioides]KQW53167.1 sulfite transporter TauE/SafE [Nocardioides sp. Root1257]KRC55854.1 sulfite transporter TauE/SafE [Nocardioides sp. Root224]